MWYKDNMSSEAGPDIYGPKPANVKDILKCVYDVCCRTLTRKITCNSIMEKGTKTAQNSNMT